MDYTITSFFRNTLQAGLLAPLRQWVQLLNLRLNVVIVTILTLRKDETSQDQILFHKKLTNRLCIQRKTKLLSKSSFLCEPSHKHFYANIHRWPSLPPHPFCLICNPQLPGRTVKLEFIVTYCRLNEFFKLSHEKS